MWSRGATRRPAAPGPPRPSVKAFDTRLRPARALPGGADQQLDCANHRAKGNAPARLEWTSLRAHLLSAPPSPSATAPRARPPRAPLLKRAARLPRAEKTKRSQTPSPRPAATARGSTVPFRWTRRGRFGSNKPRLASAPGLGAQWCARGRGARSAAAGLRARARHRRSAPIFSPRAGNQRAAAAAAQHHQALKPARALGQAGRGGRVQPAPQGQLLLRHGDGRGPSDREVCSASRRASRESRRQNAR